MPHPLQQQIGNVRGRIRRLVLIYGLSWVVGGVLVAVMLTGLADFLVRFEDRGLRVMATLVVLAVLTWTGYRYLFVGLAARLGNVELARRLGREFPGLGDALPSAVEFLGQSEDDPTAGSLALRRAVITQTTADAQRLDFRRAIHAKQTLRAVLGAVAISILAMIFVALDPVSSRIAVARLANPFGDDAWLRSTRLAVLEDGLPAETLARGDSFEVEVIDADRGKLSESTRIHYRFSEPGGKVSMDTRELRVVDSRLVAQRRNVTRSFSYRIDAGDGVESPWIPVRVVDGPLPAGKFEGPEVAVVYPVIVKPDKSGSSAAGLSLLKREKRAERVVRGRVFAVKIVDSRGAALPSDIRVHYRFDDEDGNVSEETELAHFVDSHAVARREDATRDFSYRIEGGDDHSMPWIPVEVVDPPAVESLTVELLPPEYSGRPRRRSDTRIRALVGTRVGISGLANRTLASARLCLEDGSQVQASVAGPGNRKVSVEFTVENSGAYWFGLVDRDGLEGGEEDRWEILAVADSAPSVTIEEPAANIFVTPRARVPLRIAVKDDLAIGRIDLKFSRSDRAEEADSVISLYAHQGDVPAGLEGTSGGGESGESRIVTDDWDLAELDLKPGVSVIFRGTAADFQPALGKSDPRRLTVITPEELTERIAERQAFIMAELLRVLKMQRSGRRQVAASKIKCEAVGRLNQRDIDDLRGAELNQRQVDRTLANPSEGVPMHVAGLLADLANNGIDSPDVRRRMGALLTEIERLASEHLPVIGRELTGAIKAAQVSLEEELAGESTGQEDSASVPKGDRDPAMAAGLAIAGKHQDEVIASLERMLGELSLWDNFRRFHRQVSQLLRDQEELSKRAVELARQTLTKDLKELSPRESADLKSAAKEQFELARRLDRIQQEMGGAVGQLRQSDPLAADTVVDAVALAAELMIGARMRSAGESIGANRMGRAVDDQKLVVADLREVLGVLANRRENELVRLVKKLREAETQLSELTERQEALEKQFQEAAKNPDQQKRGEDLQRLSRQQEQLKEEAQRISRQLDRLSAPEVAEKTKAASEKMDQAKKSGEKGEGQEAGKEAGAAKKDLQDAKRQLAEKRRQAEVDMATEQLARLGDTITAIRKRQQGALGETQRLEGLVHSQGQLSRAQKVSQADLARLQWLLEEETTGVAGRLVSAEVFVLALSGAARKMARSAGLLDRGRVGAKTQAVQVDALARLDQLLEALKPEPPEEEKDSQQQGRGGQGGGAKPPSSPAEALKALAQLKLLKLMQEDVNLRTEALEKTFGSLDELADEAVERYLELSEEQGRLAELILGLIAPQEDPENDPANLPGMRLEGEEDREPHPLFR
jgi:hypothetical protein